MSERQRPDEHEQLAIVREVQAAVPFLQRLADLLLQAPKRRARASAAAAEERALWSRWVSEERARGANAQRAAELADELVTQWARRYAPGTPVVSAPEAPDLHVVKNPTSQTAQHLGDEQYCEQCGGFMPPPEDAANFCSTCGGIGGHLEHCPAWISGATPTAWARRCDHRHHDGAQCERIKSHGGNHVAIVDGALRRWRFGVDR